MIIIFGVIQRPSYDKNQACNRELLMNLEDYSSFLFLNTILILIFFLVQTTITTLNNSISMTSISEWVFDV
jgi:hypothetical protein